jgi:hypothetical protein
MESIVWILIAACVGANALYALPQLYDWSYDPDADDAWWRPYALVAYMLCMSILLYFMVRIAGVPDSRGDDLDF